MHAYPTSSRRALLAGHAPSNVRAVRDILGRRGIDRIDSVPDGKTAIAAIAARPPDVLVVDWDIPASGAEAIIAAARKGETAPKIIVTMAVPTRSAVEAAKGLSVDSIVAIPFSPRVFMDRLPSLAAAAAP
jgi:two-component system KDP operon response regulator KdpE